MNVQPVTGATATAVPSVQQLITELLFVHGINPPNSSAVRFAIERVLLFGTYLVRTHEAVRYYNTRAAERSQVLSGMGIDAQDDGEWRALIRHQGQYMNHEGRLSDWLQDD